NAFELVLGNRSGLTLEGDDVDDAGAFQNRQRVFRIELGETVAGEEGPIDLLLAVFPPAPSGNRREKSFNALPFELLADNLLMARSCPDGVPLRNRVGHCAGAVTAFACCANPSSYAFFTSAFFQSMIAWPRSFTTYFCNSSRRLSVNTRSPI